MLTQYAMNWLVLGSIYGLIALGFSLLFGLLNVIHFSHGDVSMIAPFAALGALQLVAGQAAAAGAGQLLGALLVGALCAGLLGVLADRVVIRRFRGAPAMMALVATVALGNVVRETVRAVVPQGSNPKPVRPLADGFVTIGGAQVPAQQLVIIACALALVAAMYLILQRSPLGLRIRAVAEDRDIACLMAIRPERMFAAAFFLASFVGGLGALFYAANVGVVRFDFGVQLGLIGFSAAVIGGLGSMPGAIIGALTLAGIEIAVQALLPGGASYRLVFAFLLVIVTLALRPSGLLGRLVIEKV